MTTSTTEAARAMRATQLAARTPRPCAVCGAETLAMYCGATCKQRAWRARKQAARATMPAAPEGEG